MLYHVSGFDQSSGESVWLGISGAADFGADVTVFGLWSTARRAALPFASSARGTAETGVAGGEGGGVIWFDLGLSSGFT